MSSPFKNMGDLKTEEWEGEFACMENVGGYRCHGYSNIALYIPSERLLTWKCPDGHISRLEDVDDD